MEKRIEESIKATAPKIFIAKDEPVICEVSGFYDKTTGQSVFALPGRIEDENTEKFNAVHHEFIFSPVPYDKLNIYRIQSLIYNPEDQSSSINLLKLRNFLWNYHLTGWNFCDEMGNAIPLCRTPGGALADESREILFSIPANILDIAMGLFERRINIA